MKHHQTTATARVLWPAALALVLLSGCAANKTDQLYQWDGYQTQVYEYFKGETSPEKQLAAMQQGAERARTSGKRLPPGFEAHLGGLYVAMGKPDEAQQAFLAEKEAFPESSTYMDFLLKHFQQ